MTFKENDVYFHSENIHFKKDLEISLFSYRYKFTQKSKEDKDDKKKKANVREDFEDDKKEEKAEKDKEED